MRSNLCRLLVFLSCSTLAGCSQWLVGTKCDKPEDCGGGLFCDLAKHQCVESEPSPADAGGGEPADAASTADAASEPADAAGSATDAEAPLDAASVPPDAGTPDAGPPLGPPINPTLCGGAVKSDGDAGYWCTYAPKPAFGGSFLAVYGSSASDFWVAGENHTVLHWDGVQWNDLTDKPYAFGTPATAKANRIGALVGQTDGSVYLGDEVGMLASWSAQNDRFEITYSSAGAGKGYTTGFTPSDRAESWLGGTLGQLAVAEDGFVSSWTGYAGNAPLVGIAGNVGGDVFVLNDLGKLWHRNGGWMDGPVDTYSPGRALWVDGNDAYIATSSTTYRCPIASRTPNFALGSCSGLTGYSFSAVALWGGSTGTQLELWAVGSPTLNQGKLVVARSGFWTLFSDSVKDMRAVWGVGRGQVVAAGNGGTLFVHWQ